MRPPVDAEGTLRFLRELGRQLRAPTRVYLVGGASAVLEGWRPSTVDVDVRLEPDDEALRAIVQLKERLGVNVELASPADFLPELPDWRDRSPFLFREGRLEVFHYDFYSQALAKLARGLLTDLGDVEAMIAARRVDPARLGELLEAIEPELYRFPALEPALLRQAVADLARPD